MKKTADEWLQGFACALATLNRLHHHPSLIADTVTMSGLSVAKLSKAGVESYDLNEIRKCMRK